MDINELRAERLARTYNPLALMANSNNPYNYPVFHPDQSSTITYMQQPPSNNNYIPQPSFNMNYMQQPMPNLKDISDPTTAINMALVLMASSKSRELGCSEYSSESGYSESIWDECNGNGNRNNGNQIRCYSCRGLDHYARNYIEEAVIQIQAKEFDLIAAVYDSDGSAEMDQLSSAKMITTLNEEIENLNNQLSKENSTTSFLQEEKKRFKSDLLDKHIQLENKIKELDNILVKTGQLIQMMHMLSPKPESFYHTEQKMALGYQNPFYLKQAQQKQQSFYNGKVLLEKHDPPAVYDSEETLYLAQESRLKMKHLKKEINAANYTKINQLSEGFFSQKAKSREELYFSNTSKTASVSKSVSKTISIPNEEFSDDTSLSVARKFLNEVKSTIVTLQCVVKQEMTLDIHNWSSTAHQELHKIIKDEIFPIVDQVDARVQNFEIQFLKEASKFVRDFKSLAKEADESLAKYKALEYEIQRLLKVVVSQDIMSIVQSNYVVDTSNLQTEHERTKEMFKNCIIKKENEYAKLWND
ncbi:hypothetical protein Tco_0812808 [Tanacetum coccineum]